MMPGIPMTDEWTIPDRCGGTPPIDVDLALVERLAAKGCTVAEIGFLLGFKGKSFQNRKKQDTEIQDAIDAGKAKLCERLRMAQIDLALEDKNPQMLIHLGKHILGQRDVMNLNHTVEEKIDYVITFGEAYAQKDDTTTEATQETT